MFDSVVVRLFAAESQNAAFVLVFELSDPDDNQAVTDTEERCIDEYGKYLELLDAEHHRDKQADERLKLEGETDDEGVHLLQQNVLQRERPKHRDQAEDQVLEHHVVGLGDQ